MRHFGLNSGKEITRPTAIRGATIIPRQVSQQPQRELHPEAKKAAATWSQMWDELDQLRAVVQSLRNDLEVERRHVAKLEQLLDQESASKERFQRYAIAVGTHLE